MSGWLHSIWSRTRSALNERRLDRQFDEELATHFEMLVDDLRGRGLSEADARDEARRKLGRPDALRELHREQRGLPMLDVIAQDLRYAGRMLWKSPAFTAVVTLSLALGIGANTALFSLVDGLLLRSLPVREPDRLVLVQHAIAGLGIRKPMDAYPKIAFDAVRADGRVLTDVIGFRRLDRPAVSIDGAIEPSRQVDQVSDNFFADLGVAPALGRAPQPADDAVAILGDGFWRTRLGGNAGVLGKTVTINDQPYQILGVAPRRFRGLTVENSADIWIITRSPGIQQMVARLKPGVTVQQAEAAVHGLFAEIARSQPQTMPWDDRMETDLVPAGRGLSQLRAQYRGPLLALMVLVTLVLLITCTNVGNLLMLRNAGRRREIMVRVALGARRSRLVTQCLVEGVVLAALGGVLGLFVAKWGVSAVLSMLPLPALPEGLLFHPDARILGFAALVSVLCALLFGVAPALRAADVDVTSALRSSQSSTAPRKTRRLGRWLVACQVGLSLLLLVGAGLFVQTLRNLSRMDVGFNPDGLLQVLIDTRGSGYRPGAETAAVHRLLLERVAAVPGVASVSSIRNPVMRGDLSRARMNPFPGRVLEPDEAWDAVDVGPAFFETLQVRPLRGRTFDAIDFAQDRNVVAISDAFAKHYFPDTNPVGLRIGETEIVGVVQDARLGILRREYRPLMYFKMRSDPDRINALEVRVAGNIDAVARLVTQEVRQINPKLFTEVRTMRDEIDRMMAKERMVAAISAFFSILGLLIASVGIFGVASYSVAQRTSEIGIRMALGAGRWSVIRAALRDTTLVVAVGLAAGLIVAIAAVKLTASSMSDLLFGLTATNVANIAGAGAALLVVAVAACILPARRATRIDLLTAIREG